MRSRGFSGAVTGPGRSLRRIIDEGKRRRTHPNAGPHAELSFISAASPGISGNVFGSPCVHGPPGHTRTGGPPRVNHAIWDDFCARRPSPPEKRHRAAWHRHRNSLHRRNTNCCCRKPAPPPAGAIGHSRRQNRRSADRGVRPRGPCNVTHCRGGDFALSGNRRAATVAKIEPERNSCAIHCPETECRGLGFHSQHEGPTGCRMMRGKIPRHDPLGLKESAIADRHNCAPRHRREKACPAGSVRSQRAITRDSGP